MEMVIGVVLIGLGDCVGGQVQGPRQIFEQGLPWTRDEQQIRICGRCLSMVGSFLVGGLLWISGMFRLIHKEVPINSPVVVSDSRQFQRLRVRRWSSESARAISG